VSISAYWVFTTPTIIVAEYNKMVELFQKDGDTYTDRLNFEGMNELLDGGPLYGVISTEGDLWREQRRFHTLRDFGLGKNLMQERILTEVGTLIERVDADIDAGVEEHDIMRHVDRAVGSIINVIMFGFRFHGEREEEFYELKRRVSDLFKSFLDIRMSGILNYHLFKHLPFFGPFFNKVREWTLFRFYEERIEEHRRELETGGSSDDPPTDYVRVAEPTIFSHFNLTCREQLEQLKVMAAR